MALLVLIVGLFPCGISVAQDFTPAQTATQAPAAAPSFYLQGVVKSGNSPIPGATVTVINSATGQKLVTWTDLDGSYAIELPGEGGYTVRVEMAAFTPTTRDVTVSLPSTRADLALALQSRTQEAARNSAATGTGRGTGIGNRGFQSLAVMQSLSNGDSSNGGASDQVVPAGMPVPGIAPDAATESISFSGNTTGGMFSMSSDEMQQRMRESREQGGLGGAPGGFGGPGGGYRVGPGGGGPGGPGGGGGAIMFGGRGRFDINRPHGMVYYSVGDSALNAAPYSLTGQPTTKPGYLQQRFGASVGGPLNIPKIYQGGSKTFFFVNYNGSRSENPYDAFSTVPTLLERSGDFSQTVVANGPNAGSPVQIFNPTTHQPFPAEKIPQGMLNSAATGLLSFIPLPNLPGDRQNFHFITSATNNLDDLNVRLIHALGNATVGPRRRGPQNNLTFGLHYHSTGATLTNPFPSVGGNTSVRSFDIPVGYIRSIGKLTNIFRVDFNRDRISTRNLYAFSQDITGDLGIAGVSSNPFDWGLPNLSFTNFGGLQDTNPLLRRDQTWTFADSMIWNHGKHTWRWGGDFRRIQLNTETDSNARGSFIFTGIDTAQLVGGSALPGTGFDFADFLVGLPQQTSVQYGANNYHFRGNSWDLFVQDEWKVRGNLTLNLGLRYEYVSPLTELNNRIVNLDVAPGLTAAVPVLAGQAGPYHGPYPAALVNPDRNNFAPRLGLAWKARPKTVVRAGYGINYNTGAYSNIVQQLAFQPPFSITQTNIQSATTALTLQNGFPPAPPGSVTNNYGVDPDYRLGYVQIWNADVQQEIRPTLILNLDYTGTKGTRLDIVDAPNRTATGLRIPGVQPFLFEDSLGNSTAHAGTVRLRKRLQHGISVGGIYTFSKSIDNASTIGSGATTASAGGGSGGGSAGALSSGTTLVAQNAFDLAAERGLSSFDQRHKFTADYLLELPFGHDKAWLNRPGVLRDILGDWQWSGDWTIASGLPFSPRILGNFADVNRGTNGTLRPDVTGAPVALPDPSVSQWFNTAAFITPPEGQFGNARRNSIEGPDARVFDMAFTKVFPLKESRMLEFRAQLSNIFNTPQFSAIDTVVNSPTYGRVISVGAMRAIQMTARFRF